MSEMVVRAVDVGYGHIKYSRGRNTSGEILCDRFPSQSPASRDQLYVGGVMQRRDTFIVNLAGRCHEVGKEVAMALHSNTEGSVMDLDFAVSDAYRARLYGALSYIAQDLPGDNIDTLILGLPPNTYSRYSRELSNRFAGEHIVNTSGEKLVIRHCETYPQPFGSYASFLDKQDVGAVPVALIVDVGYNTCDWYVCQGMRGRLSGSSLRGMSAVINAMAKEVLNATKFDATETEVMRLIDMSLTSGTQFKLCGKSVKLERAQKVGDDVIEEAAQSVKNAIRSAGDIEVIIVTGGGAQFYKDAIRKKFPHHETRVLEDSAFGNVRGFHLIGETLAESLSKAMVKAT